ncbi:hypothetical protein ACOZ4B_19085 [Haloferax prahovense]|uniref:hypothetical protein n=1 Tax=Haloferax TaxID=2251 RepID=UPI000737D784|nr:MULTISPECIES: hypothetical protein [unclassified Haloferax]MCO8266123.1 hypothetical protein [Haloferax sp. AB510]
MAVLDKARYVLDGLRRNFTDTFWWRERFFEYVVGPFHTNVSPTRSDSVRVMDEDWDTLVLLDACRVDLFEERVDTSAYDEYRHVTSAGSTTREWVRQNFTGGEYGDTVYVTANPYVSREAGDAFHELYEVWLDDFDDELRTVHPSDVTEAAIEAHEAHPDKRVVVHYMQPHHPFIGARTLQFAGWQIEGETHGEGDGEAGGRPRTPWDALWMGAVSRDELWEAYGDNLSLVMDSVEELRSAVSGRLVVTSDHGNLLGERVFPAQIRGYGHPKGIRTPELVEVPWAVADGDDRRRVHAGDAESASASEREEMKDRLRDLGYA